MEDVELQGVSSDFEVIQCGHGVGVITSPADHAAKLVAHFLNDEVLLGRAYAIAQPYPNDVLLGQRRLPWSRLDIRCAWGRPDALLINGHSGNRRSLRKS